MSQAEREVNPDLLAAELKRLEGIFDERDRRYEERFKSSEDKVSLALSAQKELSSVVQASADKAITKSEEAQKSYNERSNEFRAQLGDQNKIQLPRSEADARFSAMDNKIDDRWKSSDSKIEDRFKTLTNQDAD